MEKLNQHLLGALAPKWRTALCGPSGCSRATETNEVHESQVRPLAWFLIATLVKAQVVALRRKPELVIAGSGLTAPIAWLAARLAGGRMVVYLHGLDVVAPSRVYSWLWLPFIRRCDLALVNSANTARLASARGVPGDRLRILHPGTEIPVLNVNRALAFRERFSFARRPLLLSVGRLTRRKGLAEFVRFALPSILQRQPAAMLVIIGEDARDALHTSGGSERERILLEARRAGVEKSLRFLGHCDEATLDQAYQACDVHVFPVLGLPRDVEGFGMVALEAAAHGLPTAAFAVGGVPDAVSDGRSGRLVREGDYEALGEAVFALLEQSRDERMRASCRDFAAGKAWPAFAGRLRELLAAVIE